MEQLQSSEYFTYFNIVLFSAKEAFNKNHVKPDAAIYFFHGNCLRNVI